MDSQESQSIISYGDEFINDRVFWYLVTKVGSYRRQESALP